MVSSMRYSSYVIIAVTALLLLLNPLISGVFAGPSREIEITASGLQPGNDEKEILEMQVDFPTASFEKKNYLGQVWDSLSMDDTVPVPVPGHPQIPAKIVTVENRLPLSKIEVIYLDPAFRDIRLIPHPRAVSPYSPVSSEYIDEDLYSEDAYIPEEDFKITLLGGTWRDGVRYWTYSLALFPVRYNPAGENAVIYSGASVSLEFRGSASLPEDLESDNGWPGEEGESPATRGSATRSGPDPKYIIITPSNFVSTLDALVQWKTKKGIPCEVHSTQDIYNDYNGVDNPEKIRNFIKDMHRQYDIKYVLLAGDYGNVPVRLCKDPDPAEGWDDGWIPAESYYACLDGTWNRDGDGYWGENGDISDIIADVSLTRIAIASTSTMRKWAEAVVNYERSPPAGDWMERSVLIGADTHQVGDGARQCDYLQDNYLRSVYGSPQEFYENGGTIDRGSLKSMMNRGVGYVNFVDHGGPVTWCQDGGRQVVYDIADVAALTNGGKRPFISAMACLTNWFDNPSGSGYQNFRECIGEYFTEDVQNGAIGYVGSSRSAIAIVGTGQYYYGAGGLQEDVCLQLGNGNLNLGDAHNDGKNRYANSFGNWFSDTQETKGEIQACWLEFNMLGDAEVPLWTNTPSHLNAKISVTPSWINVTVNDTNTGDPIQGARVCIQGAENYQRGSTNSQGRVDLFNPKSEGYAQVTVTKNNYIPLEDSIRYIDNTPPETFSSLDPAEPTGSNGWYNNIPKMTLISDDWATIMYSFEGQDAGYRTYNGPVNLPDGTEFVYFYSKDLWGNVEPPNRLDVKVDTSEPVTTLVTDPPEPTGTGAWFITPLSIKFVSNEEGTDTYYRLKVDGGARAEYIKYTDELFMNDEGEITVTFYSVDRAGNTEEAVTVEILIDRTPPDVEVLPDDEPEGNEGWYTELPEVHILSESPEDIVYYHFDELDPVIYTKPVEPPEGVHVLYSFSMDGAGNIGHGMDMEFKVDTILPEVLFVPDPEYPDGANGYYLGMPELSLVSEENNTVYYSWDGGEFQVYDPEGEMEDPGEGIVELRYFAVDVAGNTCPEETVALLVDGTTPETSAALYPAEPDGKEGWYTELEITLTSTAKDLKAIYYYFDDESEWHRYEGPISDDDIPMGVHTLHYYSADRAGNVETTSTIPLKYDSTAPRVSLRIIGDGSETGNEIKFMGFGSTDECGVKDFSIDFGDGTNTRWSTTKNFTHSYSDGGTYTVILSVRDEAGHVSKGSVEVSVKEKSSLERLNLYWKENTLYFIPGIGVLFLLLIVLTVVIIARKRSKKRRRKDDTSQPSPAEAERFSHLPAREVESSGPEPTVDYIGPSPDPGDNWGGPGISIPEDTGTGYPHGTGAGYDEGLAQGTEVDIMTGGLPYDPTLSALPGIGMTDREKRHSLPEIFDLGPVSPSPVTPDGIVNTLPTAGGEDTDRKLLALPAAGVADAESEEADERKGAVQEENAEEFRGRATRFKRRPDQKEISGSVKETSTEKSTKKVVKKTSKKTTGKESDVSKKAEPDSLDAWKL